MRRWIPTGDTVRRGLVFFGAIYVLVLTALVPIQQYEYNKSQDRQHAQTVALDRRIIGLEHEVTVLLRSHSAELGAIASLQKQVAVVIDGLPAANAYLGKLAIGLENQVISLCNAVHASCGGLPVTLPSSSTSAASTSTTTTPAAPRPPLPTTTTTTTTRPTTTTTRPVTTTTTTQPLVCLLGVCLSAGRHR